MQISKIALIGCGQIGLRHLQALANINLDIYLQVVDPLEEALNRAKDEMAKIVEEGKIKKIDYLKDFSSLLSELDLVIIATNSDVRRDVIKKVLELKNVNYLILEKILFQRKEHFNEIDEIMRNKKVKAWVNCPLRTLSFYKELKQMLSGSSLIDYQVSYSNLGIATNAIHHIDLFSYLTDEIEFKFDSSYLDKKIISSKRHGFVEFTGTLSGSSKMGNRIMITSYFDGDVPPLVQICSDKLRCLIRENEQKAYISNEKNNWVWKEIEYFRPYQSQLTHLFVQQILETGNSDLPPYSISWQLHLPLLEELNKFLQKIRSNKVITCPIT